MDYKTVKSLCNKLGIAGWYFNEKTGTVDVHEGVMIYGKGLTSIPIKFGKVTSYFDCSNNNLTTLKNSPSYVGGMFNCSRNYLTSLDDFPLYVRSCYILLNNFKKRQSLVNCQEHIYANNLWRF